MLSDGCQFSCSAAVAFHRALFYLFILFIDDIGVICNP